MVNRNINYTNVCAYKCTFCAFSKGPKSLNLRGEPYLLTPEEERVDQATGHLRFDIALLEWVAERRLRRR